MKKPSYFLTIVAMISIVAASLICTTRPSEASGSASIICRGEHPVMQVTYSPDADANQPGLFWFGVLSADQSLGAYYDTSSTWQSYTGGLYPPMAVYQDALPSTISFEVPWPNSDTTTDAYVGYSVYAAHGVYTAEGQAAVALRTQLLSDNKSTMDAAGTWSTEYEPARDTMKTAWAEIQKDMTDNSKYALLLTIPSMNCAAASTTTTVADSGTGSTDTSPTDTTTTTVVDTVTAPSGTLSADKTTIKRIGVTVTLTWTTSNAVSASIDNGVGAVNISGGSISVKINEDPTTYTLTTVNSTGVTFTTSVTIGTEDSGSCERYSNFGQSGSGDVNTVWSGACK